MRGQDDGFAGQRFEMGLVTMQRNPNLCRSAQWRHIQKNNPVQRQTNRIRCAYVDSDDPSLNWAVVTIAQNRLGNALRSQKGEDKTNTHGQNAHADCTRYEFILS